jgi:SRSO17 transposase
MGRRLLRGRTMEWGAGRTGADWEEEFGRWIAPFLDALGDRRRRQWAPLYVRGLLGPGERKSIAPLVEQVAPGDYQQLHHFVNDARWEPAPLEAELARAADALVGGPEAVLIVDDTALLKRGTHSVGVAVQYAGCVQRPANCQTLVSLTLARGEVPVGLGLKLFLPRAWTDDPERCAAAGVPEAERVTQAAGHKGALALREIDRVRAAGVRFGVVLTDAGSEYGADAAFRRALSARGLTWAVGIHPRQQVYPADVEFVVPPRTGRRGPAPRVPVPNAPSGEARGVLAAARWRTHSWRTGTTGRLAARFAAVRVRVGDGPLRGDIHHLPGEPAWLVGEERATGERRYYLTNHPADARLRTLVGALKQRWACEQLHQQLKEELGLDHFEGRRWRGLHHHALLTLISFAFLQHLRLRERRPREKNRAGPRRAAAQADAPRRAAPAPGVAGPRPG